MSKQKFEKEEAAKVFSFDYDSEPLTKVVNVQDEGRDPATITVTVVNWDLGDTALVKSKDNEYKILPKSELSHSYHEQNIPFSLFLGGVAPYDWAEEINTVALSPDEMRHILYTQGYVVKSPLSLAEFAKVTLVRGKIPVKKE